MASLGAEFLLCIQAQSPGGGIWNNLLPTHREDDSYTTSIAGIAFIERFKIFGSQTYKDAAISAGDWVLSHPTFSHLYPGDPYRFYSDPNQHARQVLFLAEIYQITGKQQYLDRAIEISEEIICWQDYQDSRDPFNEPPGPNGEWDGG